MITRAAIIPRKISIAMATAPARMRFLVLALISLPLLCARARNLRSKNIMIGLIR